MRRILIIYFDLPNPAVINRIMAYEGWAMIGSSVYLIATEFDVIEVRNELMAILRAGSKLFVGTAPAPSAWTGLNNEVSQWIVDNQH